MKTKLTGITITSLFIVIMVVIFGCFLSDAEIISDGVIQEDVKDTVTISMTTGEVVMTTVPTTSITETTGTTYITSTTTTTPVMTESVVVTTENIVVPAAIIMCSEFTITETEPVIIESDKLYFYRESMRVHRSNCIHADPSCMEVIEGDYIDTARKCTVCNPDISIGTIYEEPYIEEAETVDEYENPENGGLERNWTVSEMTYYSGPSGCCGKAERILIDNYSVACNSIPLGTIIYIESSYGVNGYYRVDDTGGMGNNVIDIFYSDYSNTPSSFRRDGRVSCTVYIVE